MAKKIIIKSCCDCPYFERMDDTPDFCSYGDNEIDVPDGQRYEFNATYIDETCQLDGDEKDFYKIRIKELESLSRDFTETFENAGDYHEQIAVAISFYRKFKTYLQDKK